MRWLKTKPSLVNSVELNRLQQGKILFQYQFHCLQKPEMIDQNSNLLYSYFSSAFMKLAWSANTQLDCVFEIWQLAQFTEKVFKQFPHEWITRLNGPIKYACDNKNHVEFFRPHRSSLQIIGFLVAAFSNSQDYSLRFAHIILVGGKHDKVIPLAFKSYKTRLITRSEMSTEIISFSEMSDSSITVMANSPLYYQHVPMQLFIDSKRSYDIITKNRKRLRTEKCLILLQVAKPFAT